jgi:hypothetical protein
MRRAIVAVVIGVLSGVAAAADTGTTVLSGATKVLVLGTERLQVTYELTGITFSDSGLSPLHNASARCIGGFHAVNGVFDDESGSCVYTAQNGDQAFLVYRGSGKVGLESKGKGTFVGGTGRLANWRHSVKFTRTWARPALEGTIQVISRWEAYVD